MQDEAPPPRKIIHVDMDAFYASVEQRDRPELRGKPVIVGGTPDSRGVVCTASYEARAFGVRSAMPAAHAKRLCPQGIFLIPDFAKYAAVSQQIRALFRSITDLVEPLSLDEAYLDVTVNKPGNPSATRLAEELRAAILRETRLTASAGVGPNKFIAKVASDLNKPDGLCVVPPEQVPAFVRDLPVRKIPGIGPVTEQRCRERGIERCRDFLRFDDVELAEWFGSSGPWFRRLARGQDDRPVVPDQERVSCSVEDTFARDLRGRAALLPELARLAEVLEDRLADDGIGGRTVTLKVKYADFRLATRSRSFEHPVHARDELYAAAQDLLEETEAATTPVRLLGIGVSRLAIDDGRRQGRLPYDGVLGAETG